MRVLPFDVQEVAGPIGRELRIVYLVEPEALWAFSGSDILPLLPGHEKPPKPC